MSLLSFVSARRGVVPVLAAAIAVTLAPRAVRAQYTIDQRAGTQRRGPRFTVGGGVEYAQPVSQFRQNVDHGLDRVRDATRERREDADGQEADHSQDDAVLGHRLALLAREPSAEIVDPLRIRHVRFTSLRQLERVAARAGNQ